MKNIFVFSARKTFRGGKWRWIPSLGSLSGKNFWWPNKNFRSKQGAIAFLKRNLDEIKKNYF